MEVLLCRWRNTSREFRSKRVRSIDSISRPIPDTIKVACGLERKPRGSAKRPAPWSRDPLVTGHRAGLFFLQRQPERALRATSSSTSSAFLSLAFQANARQMVLFEYQRVESSSLQTALACIATMWRGELGHEVGNPYSTRWVVSALPCTPSPCIGRYPNHSGTTGALFPCGSRRLGNPIVSRLRWSVLRFPFLLSFPDHFG